MILATLCLLAAAAPPVLEGVVVDPKGAPVAGARVLATAVDARADVPLCATTGPDGKLRVALRRGGIHRVRVLADGFAPVLLQDVDVTKPLRVQLQEGARIEGVVRDSTTRQPVAGATVTARGLYENAVSGYELLDASAKTDATGRFVLRGLKPGTHTLAAFARGYRRQTRPGAEAVAKPLRPLEIFVSPGGSTTGLVRDARGRPVDGALVFFRPSDRQFVEPPVARTAKDGTFETGVLPGNYTVIALHEAHAPALVRDVAVDDRGGQVDLQLSPPSTVTARLVDGDGRAREGEVALAAIDEAEVPMDVGRLVRVASSADGRVELERVPPGLLRLAISARGFAKRFVDVSVPVPRGTADAVVDAGDVVLEVGHAVRGRVHDPQGRGIAGAHVHAQGGMTWSESESNADGSFTIAGLAEGKQQVMAGADGWSSWTGEALADGEPVDVTLTPEAVIVAKVVDPQGNAVPRFTASASDADDPDAWGWSEETFEDGALRLRGLKPGTYGVRVQARDFAAATRTGVKLKAGETADAGTIRLTPGTRLTGVVVDGSGAALAGAEVEIFAAERAVFNDRVVAATEGDGSFAFGGLQPGRYELMAKHPAFAASRLDAVTIPESGPAPAVRITLKAGGTLNGVVRARTPVQGFVVAGRGIMGSAQGTIAADGTFSIPHVSAGETAATLVAQVAPGRMQGIRRATVDVPEGGEASVEFTLREIRVHGRLTGPDGPVANARLAFSRTDNSMRMFFSSAAAGGPVVERNQTLTREDGSFDLVLDDTGSDFMVRVEALDRSFAQTLRNVMIPDVDEHQLELVLPGARVAGLVTDAATGQPVVAATVSVVREPRDSNPAPVSLTTGRDGTFIAYVGEGRHRVTAGSRGYAAASQVVDVAASGAELRLALEKGSALRGVVVDARGGPVGQGTVTVTPASGERLPAGRWLEPDGRFVVDGLPAGTYNVLAGTEGSGWAFAPNVSVPGEIRLATAPGGLAEITVTCAGQRSPTRWVSIERVGDAALYARPQFRGEGDRLVMSLPVGRLELRASAMGCADRTLTVDVAAGRTVTRVIDLAAQP